MVCREGSLLLKRYAIVAAVVIASASLAMSRAAASDGPDGGAILSPHSLAVDTAGNAVLEPNETVEMAPNWSSLWMPPGIYTGTTSSFTGPAGATYENPDTVATYDIPELGGASCRGTGNCYSIRVTAAARPMTHWDATIVEAMAFPPSPTTWTVHVGASFADVAVSSPFYRFVEAILHKNVTSGCAATTYCPASATTRGQMAVFVLAARSPVVYTPPACGATPMFSDVPVSSPFCRWVEELARRGVTSGCAPGLYCPTATVTREQMAVFVLRTLDPSLNPPACGTPVFADVPASSAFCPWIEDLVRRRVVTGCGAGNFCPTAAVSREQMAVFLAVTYGLPLYSVSF
jgi:hypothetical protein